MKIRLLWLPLFLLIVTSGYAQSAETLRFETYISSPIGVYDQIRLVPTNPASLTCNASTLGTMFVNSQENNSLYYCRTVGMMPAFIPPGLWTETAPTKVFLSDTATANLKKIGIGTINPPFKLSLDNDGGILAQGTTVGIGTTLTTTGVGTRFIWYPQKSALRAGEIDAVVPFNAYWNDSNIGFRTIAFGFNNKVVSRNSSILGGGYNQIDMAIATDDAIGHSVIGGGNRNTLSGGATESAIVGGENNIASDQYSFIGGGGGSTVALGNTADYGSTVGGGAGNIPAITGGATDVGTIIGGNFNTFLHSHPLNSTISGGVSNTIQAATYTGTIGGGGNITSPTGPNLGNKVASQRATVAGGYINQALGLASIVGGGENNTADGMYPTIGGGSNNNTTSGDYPTILGGQSNSIVASTNWGTIGGGALNTLGGAGIQTIGGGNQNSITPGSSFSTIIGGFNNSIAADFAFIGGGEGNSSGLKSVVPGGRFNSALGIDAFASGKNMKLTSAANNTFVWGYSDTAVTIATPNAFLIDPNNYNSGVVQVGIGTTAFPLPAGQKLTVNGDVIVGGSLFITNTGIATGGTILRINTTTGAIGLDIAETFETSEQVEAGDLLIIDLSQNSKLKKSSTPFDKKVIGIVSAAPAITFEGSQMTIASTPVTFTKGTNPPVALSGRVLCKVSLENGEIDAGDLLTSSSTPGYAMKAGDWKQSFDSVAGKALEPFHGGSNGEKIGMIQMMVIRQ